MTNETPQRFTFDQVAELYDRARPGYPKELVDEVVTLSGIPAGGRILEIGCGTGQLTVSLAERGFRLVCLEPGASLAALARKRLASFPSVEVTQTTFEAWPLERGAFDLVVSAQAFHWVDPALRFTKTADALRPGGALAVVGNAIPREESAIRTALDDAYRTHAPHMLGAGGAAWYEQEPLMRGLFAESGRFGEVAARHIPWRESHSADHYVELMRTHSDHALLPETTRESLLAAVHEAIATRGGSFEVGYEAHLYLARTKGAE